MVAHSHSCSSLELAEGFPLDASVLIVVDSFATDTAKKMFSCIYALASLSPIN
jgi:hypothetical protein